MKRILSVFCIALCVLVGTQAVSLADTVSVTSPDDPGFDGGTVTGTNYEDLTRTLTAFQAGSAWQPTALTSGERLALTTKEEALATSIATAKAASSEMYTYLSGAVETSGTKAIIPSSVSLDASGTFDPRMVTPGTLAWWRFTWFKIPNYNQGQTPYCGPFSALQILRYKRYSEYNLLQHLINEMYVAGQGSNIYRLAQSLRTRLKYPYWPGSVVTPVDYGFKHILTVGRDRMPIDNLVRIYGGRLGRYRRYHSGHYIDSSGYAFDASRHAVLYITDTYQEYVNGTSSGTLGPKWVSFAQMYFGVMLHPQRKVVW